MTDPKWIWCAMPGAARTTAMKADIADYGDGYTHRATRGLNPARPNWQLEFPFTDLAMLAAMNTFLETYAVPGFYFEPPDATGTELFVTCDQWSATVSDRTGSGARVGTLGAQFVRAFNPQPS